MPNPETSIWRAGSEATEPSEKTFCEHMLAWRSHVAHQATGHARSETLLEIQSLVGPTFLTSACFWLVRAAFPSWCYNEQHNVSSVLMPMLSGVLMPIISFRGVFLLTAGILLASVPFARALQTKIPQPLPAAACGP